MGERWGTPGQVSSLSVILFKASQRETSEWFSDEYRSRESDGSEDNPNLCTFTQTLVDQVFRSFTYVKVIM